MDFGNYQKELFKRKPEPGIHSYAHKIVKEVCEWIGDKGYKEFGRWLGVAKALGGGKAEDGAGELKAKLDYVKERGITSAKYLAVCCKVKKCSGDN